MTQIERQMWEILKEQSDNEPGRTVRISKLAVDRTPVANKKQATEIVKSWDNRGLVNATQNGAQASLTQIGVTTDEP